MTICKTLSFALVAVLFTGCVASTARPDAKSSRSMDMARSDLDASDAPGQSINPAGAKNHIGKRQTVCGVVVSASYAARSPGRPTFLYLDEPYPGRAFTAVIQGEDR